MAADWVCSASRDYPVDKDAAWDGAAAEASIFKAWGFDGDNPETAKAAKCFLAHDASAPKLRGSYKLPFAVVRDGKPVAIAAGIRAAASRLSNTDIPDEVKNSARAVIDAYEKKAGMGDGENSAIPPKKKPKPLSDIEADGDNPSQDEPDDIGAVTGDAYRDDIETCFPVIYAARVALIRAPSLQPPDPEKLALDPDIFAQNPPFAFRAEISNDREDAYYTRMHPSSLKNYANDADEGVALQNSHRADELPLGHSYRGRFLKGESQPDQIARTHADFYVVPGLKLSDVSADDLIKGIKARVVRDMSVGFYGGEARCTICGNDLCDERACGHVPGLTYRIKRSNGDEDEQKGAAWIHNARLAECSMVYDGATPGAAVIKAQRMAEAGRLSPYQARWLETQYRVQLGTATRRYFPGYEPARREEKRMNGPIPRQFDDRQGLPGATDPNSGLPAQTEPNLADLMTAAGFSSGDVNTDLRAMIAEYQRLKQGAAPPPDADGQRSTPPVTVTEREVADARTYRAQLIEEARVEGVRALDPGFDAARFLKRCERMELDEIRQERDTFAAIAKARYPGGRLTRDRAEPPAGSNGAVPPVPDSVYAS